jgi:CheY-like chemotaxis protein
VKVLIIEEERMIREVLRRILSVVLKEIMGSAVQVDIVEADNGVDGTKAIWEKRPDIVFLDYLMPKKNGIEVLQEVCDLVVLEGLKIFFMTGANDNEVFEKARELGVSGVLSKPFSSKDVENALREHFHRKSNPPPAEEPPPELVA